jgi:hypothetical protein
MGGYLTDIKKDRRSSVLWSSKAHGPLVLQPAGEIGIKARAKLDDPTRFQRDKQPEQVKSALNYHPHRMHRTYMVPYSKKLYASSTYPQGRATNEVEDLACAFFGINIGDIQMRSIDIAKLEQLTRISHS